MDDTPRAARARYDDDAYAWAFEQAALLRAGRWSELDIEHLADEIESVGKSERRELESALRLVLMHLLKWDHQPEKRSRSWTITIANQRDHAARTLAENRSLKPRLGDIVADAYRLARREASGDRPRPRHVPRGLPLRFRRHHDPAHRVAGSRPRQRFIEGLRQPA